MTVGTSSRTNRLQIVFDLAIVLVFAIFLWTPWDRSASTGSSSITMAWLSLPMMLARRGLHLAYATDTVTISAVAAAALGGLLSIAAGMRGSAALGAVGTLLFGASVAILMPMWTAISFLGALLLIVILRARFVTMGRATALVALLRELWPIGYAIGFAVLAWRYNPQLLLKALVIALGVSLVARALLPSTAAAS
ncbi:MAG TPA: hypothetical protein VF018_10520 [Acidobacteriaceae bacterium]